MTEIALQSYNQEIKDLVDQGHFDEAVAHCQHILETFPRHIETYRILGKAFLEQGRHGDAADVFQRVLSAIPEDWLSHVAMSIVREDESNLDMAIWHMERAYEVNPSNPTVQQEVRRLRGRRDGVEPPKLRLTRSALARMYIKGGLFGQAIAEIRSALAEDPDRPDLQVLLASALFDSGAVQEAADICNTILQKLPYCLEANRVMGLALLASNKPDDAENLFQRIASLDPYIDLDVLKKEKRIAEHPGQAITLSHLEYEGQEKTVRTKQPSWASSLGLKIEEEKPRQAVPDWVSATSQQPSAPAAPSGTGAGLPPWLSEAANAMSSSGTVGGTPPPPAAEPPIARTTTGELPDWITPQSVSEEPPAAEKPSAPLPDWLSTASMPPEAETPPPSTDSSTLPDWIKTASLNSDQPKEKIEDIPDWLSTPPPPSVEGLPSSSLPEGMRPETKTGPLEVEPGNIPDWLSSSQPTSADVGPEPEWLKQAPAEAPTAETLPEWMQGVQPAETPSKESQPEENVPEWLRESPAPASKPVELVPEWMRPETPSPGEAKPEKPPVQPTPAEELPEWMKPDQAETPVFPPSKPVFEGKTETPPPETSAPQAMPAAAAEVDMPDWMREPSSEAQAAPTAAAEAVPGEGIPDWLKPPEQAAEKTAAPPAEAAAEVSLPDWLQTPPGTAPATQEPAEATPAEMAEAPAQEAAQPPPDETPEIELPDWLKAVPTKPQVQAKEPETPSKRVEPVAAPAEPAPSFAAPVVQEEKPKEAAAKTPLSPAEGQLPREETKPSPPPSEPGPAHVTPTASNGIDLPEWLVSQLQGKPKTPSPGTTDSQPATPLPDWLKPATPGAAPPQVVDWDKAASQQLPPAPVDATTPATGISAPASEKPTGTGTGSDTVARWLDRRLKTSTLSSLDESALKAGIKPSSPPSTARTGKGTKQLPTWLDSQKPGGSDTVVRWMDKRETGSLRRQTATFSSVSKAPVPTESEEKAPPSVTAPEPRAVNAPAAVEKVEDTIAAKKLSVPSEDTTPSVKAPPLKPPEAAAVPVEGKAKPQQIEKVDAADEEEEGEFVPPPEWLEKALGSAVAEVPPVPKKQTGGLKPGTVAPIAKSAKVPSRKPVAEAKPAVSLPAATPQAAVPVEESPPATAAKSGSWVPLAQTPAAKKEKPAKKSSRRKSKKRSDAEIEALIQEARTYLETDLQKASEAYQQVIDDPSSAEIVVGDLTTYLEQDPASPQLWNLLGDACSRAGKLQDAYRAYAEALRRM